MIWAWMLAWVVTTPFGRPVVPLVKRIMARRSGSTRGSGTGSSVHLLDEEESNPSGIGQGTEQIGVSRRGDGDDRRRGVEHVLQLGCRVGETERDGDPAGPPDRPLDPDVVERRLDHEHDPGLVEVRLAIEEAGYRPLRSVEQIRVGVSPGLIGDGNPVRPLPEARSIKEMDSPIRCHLAPGADDDDVPVRVGDPRHPFAPRLIVRLLEDRSHQQP